jgi:hypothetical protein
MKKLIILFIISISLLGCGQIKNDDLDPYEVRFKTTDASKLFFKNTRRSFYKLEELQDAKLEVFRWKKSLDDEFPQLHLALVNNWRYDEAYLLIEPNTFIDLNELKLRWKSEDGEIGEIRFEPGNKTNDAQFAGLVYQQLRKESQFEIWTNGKWRPFFTEAESQEAFETTVYDFYRLTERL